MAHHSPLPASDSKQPPCPCIAGQPSDCAYGDGEQTIKGVRIPVFVLGREHKLNRQQEWAIFTRTNKDPVPAVLASLIQVTNNRPGLLPEGSSEGSNGPVSTPAPVVDTWANSIIFAYRSPHSFSTWKEQSPTKGYPMQQSLTDYGAMKSKMHQEPALPPPSILPSWPMRLNGYIFPDPWAVDFTTTNTTDLTDNCLFARMSMDQSLLYSLALHEVKTDALRTFDYNHILSPDQATYVVDYVLDQSRHSSLVIFDRAFMHGVSAPISPGEAVNAAYELMGLAHPSPSSDSIDAVDSDETIDDTITESDEMIDDLISESDETVDDAEIKEIERMDVAYALLEFSRCGFEY